MSATETPARPGLFRLPGYEVAVGPYSHVAAERDRLAALRWRHFDARALGATVGGEISGVDLGAELPDEVVADIRQALADYKVLFFRDQALTPERHVAFARRFGELEVHPFLPSNTGEPELVRFEKTAEVTGYENSWHHDVTWRECPSMGAVLHAIRVPERGGDTLFADMYAAYDALDDATKAEIDGLTAVHDFTQTFGHSMSRTTARAAQEKYPPVRHPVVCTHPRRGSCTCTSTGRSRATLRVSVRTSPRPAGPAVPPGRRARAPVPLHLDGGRGRLLGQPRRAALRIERLLAAPAHDGEGLHRRAEARAGQLGGWPYEVTERKTTGRRPRRSGPWATSPSNWSESPGLSS